MIFINPRNNAHDNILLPKPYVEENGPSSQILQQYGVDSIEAPTGAVCPQYLESNPQGYVYLLNLLNFLLVMVIQSTLPNIGELVTFWMDGSIQYLHVNMILVSTKRKKIKNQNI